MRACSFLTRSCGSVDTAEVCGRGDAVFLEAQPPVDSRSVKTQAHTVGQQVWAYRDGQGHPWD